MPSNLEIEATPTLAEWRREVGAILRKEIQSELRSPSGVMASGLFAVATVVALSAATFREPVGAGVAAGMIWVALLFSATAALPRSFVTEEEQRTADLLRLWARPEAVFWGKAIANLLQLLITASVLASLYFLFVPLRMSEAGDKVSNLPLLAAALMSGCVGLAGTLTLYGALVAPAKNRSVLAGAISIPALLPFLFMAVNGLKLGIDPGLVGNGWLAVVGMACYGVITMALGPYLYSAIWKS